MLNAKELLSGVKRTSNVVAPIPLLSIHVASDFDPMALIASTGCKRANRKKENIKTIEDIDALCGRFCIEKRIAPEKYVR